MNANDNSYQLLLVQNLQRGRYQPRIDFAEESLQELAQSIRTQGLIEPVIVREVACERYEIIAGERRWRAAMLAGLLHIPCLIGRYTDQQAATLTLVENIQRQELNLIEEASGYRRLIDEFNLQQDEIAALVSKSRSHIANLLRLLSLASEVQSFLRAGQLSLGHARLLVSLTTNSQIQLAKDTLDQHWSVRQLEEKVRLLKNKATETLPTSLPQQRDVARLESMLSEQIGSPVQISSEKGQGGWLQIKFFDNDTLAGLLERMGLRYD